MENKPEGPYRIVNGIFEGPTDLNHMIVVLPGQKIGVVSNLIELANKVHGAGFKSGRASRDRLREALIPFTHADLREILTGNAIGEDSPVFQRNKAMLRIKDFSKAYEALAEDEKNGGGEKETGHV